MFSYLDRFFISLSTRFMKWLGETFDLNAPKILRESLMAFLASYAAFGLCVLATGDVLAKGAVILFGAVIAKNLVQILQGYAADADKDWTSQLAMKYMAKAVGKQEGMKFARLVGWLSLMLFPLAGWLTGVKQPFMFVFVYYAAMGSGLLHEYLSAAEPTAPGKRRQATQMQMAHANMR